MRQLKVLVFGSSLLLIGLAVFGSPARAGGCNVGEALQGVAWVLDQDQGARATFNAAYARSGNAYTAVLAAQAHNRRAQDSIALCAPEMQRVLLDRGFILGGAPEAAANRPTIAVGVTLH